MEQYIVLTELSQRQIVGVLNLEKINRILGTNHQFSPNVWMYPGLKKHVQKKHPGVWEMYHEYIPDVIENPDYIGQNPKEPDSIEMIKKVSDDILLAIKLDPSGYLFISTFFNLKNAEHKIQKRLGSGRIKPYV